MPKKLIETFSVEWLQILEEDGICDEELRPPLSNEEIKKLFEWMVLARTFDEKAFKLQREGRLGTYASIHGQEAAQVGSAFALRPADWMFPAFREPGASFVRGLPMHMILQYWAGDERGSQIPEGLNDFPITIPVATQIPIAVGVALAAKAKGDPIAVMAYMGDGATSKGDFHEGLNFAGVFSAPVVFVCQNNQWAISVPLKRQTASKTLAQKAFAYGFPGIRVDGNDIFAVYQVTREAVDRARQGGGPTLIEAVTYRLGPHTTSDDPSRYRDVDEVAEWKERDPLERVRRYLSANDAWSEAWQADLEAEASEEIERAVGLAEGLAPPAAEEMFLAMFEEPTPALLSQQAELMGPR